MKKVGLPARIRRGANEAMSDFLKKVSRSLGLSYTWWHWRWLNFKKRWSEDRSS